jgi:hypothetical protein
VPRRSAWCRPPGWAIVAYLRTHGGWDEAQARITFVPASRPRAGFEFKTAGLRIASITIETA